MDIQINMRIMPISQAYVPWYRLTLHIFDHYYLTSLQCAPTL